MTALFASKGGWRPWLRWTISYMLALIVGLFVFIASWYITGFMASLIVGDEAALYVGGVFSGAAGGAAFGLMHWFIWHGKASGANHWMLLNAVAWAMGLPLFMFVANMIHAIPAGLVLGFVIGGMQWLMLRKQFNYAIVWVAMSMLVWMIGWEVAKAPYGTLLSIVIIGTISGLTMMWLLNYPKQPIVNG
jgi:hypothetical protein